MGDIAVVVIGVRGAPKMIAVPYVITDELRAPVIGGGLVVRRVRHTLVMAPRVSHSDVGVYVIRGKHNEFAVCWYVDFVMRRPVFFFQTSVDPETTSQFRLLDLYGNSVVDRVELYQRLRDLCNEHLPRPWAQECIPKIREGLCTGQSEFVPDFKTIHKNHFALATSSLDGGG